MIRGRSVVAAGCLSSGKQKLVLSNTQNRSVGIVTDTERNEIVSEEKCRGVSNRKKWRRKKCLSSGKQKLVLNRDSEQVCGIVTDTPFPEKQERGANVKTRKS